MSFLKLWKPFLVLSSVLFGASVVMLFAPGPKLSIEFTGGTLMELDLPAEHDTNEALDEALRSFPQARTAIENRSIARAKNDTFFLRTGTLTNEEHLALLAHLQTKLGDVKELQFTTIGPTVGQTLKRRALWALVVATVAIICYLALAFRKVPRSLSSWKFGIIAVIALLHDVTITAGIFTILSYTTTFQFDTLFATALLSIMGYSVNDTIVIFDRIRENLFEEGRVRDFATLAEQSLKQTMTRTLNTGFGALIMLTTLFFLGSESIRWFILALVIGTIIGTYSSFFIATPLLVYWRKKA
jgi:preprotein translocase subunit SecF